MDRLKMKRWIKIWILPYSWKQLCEQDNREGKEKTWEGEGKRRKMAIMMRSVWYYPLASLWWYLIYCSELLSLCTLTETEVCSLPIAKNIHWAAQGSVVPRRTLTDPCFHRYRARKKWRHITPICSKTHKSPKYPHTTTRNRRGTIQIYTST